MDGVVPISVGDDHQVSVSLEPRGIDYFAVENSLYLCPLWGLNPYPLFPPLWGKEGPSYRGAELSSEAPPSPRES